MILRRRRIAGGMVKWEMVCGDAIVGLSPHQMLIVMALAGVPGRIVSKDDLIESIWGDDEDGGPLDAYGVLKVQICRIRQRLALAKFPWTIETCGMHGVRWEYVESVRFLHGNAGHHRALVESTRIEHGRIADREVHRLSLEAGPEPEVPGPA